MVINVDWNSFPEQLHFIGDINNNGVLIGLIPHENEPLGVLIFNCDFFKLAENYAEQLSFCINMDIPKKKHRFSLPINFENFYLKYYLKTLDEQLEFSYVDNPVTNMEKRAQNFYKIAKNKDLIILLHNDPVRDFFYLYSNENHLIMNKIIKDVNYFILKTNKTLEEVSYTEKLNDYIYKYFKLKNIITHENHKESFGVYFKKKGLKVFTIEIPMFNWNLLDSTNINILKNLYIKSISGNFSHIERKKYILQNKIIIPNLPMIPLNKLTAGLNKIIDSLIKTELGRNF